MNAELKEFFDATNEIVVAIVWVTAAPNNVAQMNLARVKLNEFISNYVANKGHNIYMHTENDTVSATIVYDINKYQGRTIQI